MCDGRQAETSDQANTMKTSSSGLLVMLLCSLTLPTLVHGRALHSARPSANRRTPAAASAVAKPTKQVFQTSGPHPITLTLLPNGTYSKVWVMSTGGNGVDHLDGEEGTYVITGHQIVFKTQDGTVSKARYFTTRIRFPDALFRLHRGLHP